MGLSLQVLLLLVDLGPSGDSPDVVMISRQPHKPSQLYLNQTTIVFFTSKIICDAFIILQGSPHTPGVTHFNPCSSMPSTRAYISGNVKRSFPILRRGHLSEMGKWGLTRWGGLTIIKQREQSDMVSNALLVK